jgi:hypothetical protein
VRTSPGWALMVAAGCAGAQRPNPVEYPTTLTAPSTHPGDFIRRQKLVVTFHGQTRGLEAVLQKRGNELVLVGLTPFGTRAFVLKQTGLEVQFQSYYGPAPPFPPRYMLDDISRTYFAGIGDQPLEDGGHRITRDGELIEEEWKNGRLLRRRFERVARDPPGEIVITYVGGMASTVSPVLIELDNGWLGYHLSVTTLSEEAL